MIEVICGSMFSGKTEELLRRIRRAQIGRQKIQVFKPALDTRYGVDHVQSHNQSRIASIPVQVSKDILNVVEDTTRVVGIDEAQFFDAGIVEVCQRLANRGVRVIVAGLDMDFKGRPFGPMPELLAVAESVDKLSAVCVVCGERASRSQRLAVDGSDQQIVLGAQDVYEARCRHCHSSEIEKAVPAPRRPLGDSTSVTSHAH